MQRATLGLVGHMNRRVPVLLQSVHAEVVESVSRRTHFLEGHGLQVPWDTDHVVSVVRLVGMFLHLALGRCLSQRS